MTAIAAAPVAFDEAIRFLRSKVRIPSERSDELRGAIHAKAFTVAGATKTQLLTDLHDAVDTAIEQGQGIGEFRKRFDQVVAEHGWSYRGQRGWRTRVIYDTNLRTAHSAGRWEQIQRTKDRRPYLQYQTAGDTRVRAEHEAWDGTVLPVDHEWWTTHYPPNGWGCRCIVRTLSQSQMEREGLTVSRDPRVEKSERVNTRTGEVYGDVPVGIDTGWDYNVGQAWLAPERVLGELIMTLPPAVRSRALESLRASATRLDEPFRAWATQVLQSDSAGAQIAVGYLSEETVRFVLEQGVELSTVTVTLLEQHLRRMVRDVARRGGKATLPRAILMDIPGRLANPEAVLWDRRKRNLVFSSHLATGSGDARARLIVQVEFSRKGARANAVISGGVVDAGTLRNGGVYEIVSGRP